jgi:hypothetical protein
MTTLPQPEALARFLAAASDSEAVAILNEEHTQLLTEAASQALTAQLAAESDPARREWLAARQALLHAALEWRAQLATMTDAERLLLEFQSVANAVEMIRLAAGVDEAALDTLEATVADKLTTLVSAGEASEEAAGLRQRLESLRAIREQGVETLAAQLDSAMNEAAQQTQALANRLIDWIQTPGWHASEALLQEHADELLTDAGAATLQMLQEAKQGNAEIEFHINLLTACLEHGIVAAYTQLRQAMALNDMQALANRLVEWIQTPDWNASEAFLQEHADELLTDAGATALQMLQEANEGHEEIKLHITLLGSCREQGLAAAYAQLRQEIEAHATAETLANSPLLQAVVEFLRAENDEAARRVLETRRSILLTLDARRTIDGFLATAHQQGDEAAQTRLAARLALWQTVRFGAPGADHNLQSSATLTQIDTTHTLAQTQRLAEEAPKYNIIEAYNCAIGDHAQTLNILTMGVHVPLQWKKPQQFRDDLTERAVGRVAELIDLDQLLQRDGDAAVVGSGAVRGLPGIGKSTLAALYAQEHTADFPGGVIWLQLGPSYTTAASVEVVISELAAFAYSGDVQAYQALAQASSPTQAEQLLATLKNSVFKPEAVRLLLSDHGRLLFIVDDVWDVAVLDPVRRARPHDAALLVTTRDSRVAHRVGDVLELDVLSQADALAMIGRILPAMGPAIYGQSWLGHRLG